MRQSHVSPPASATSDVVNIAACPSFPRYSIFISEIQFMILLGQTWIFGFGGLIEGHGGNRNGKSLRDTLLLSIDSKPSICPVPHTIVMPL